MASLPATLFDALRESHAIQRALCSRLTRTRASHPEARLEAYRLLKLELAAHAASEERHLYAPILMDDGGLNSARHAMHEHHEIDELVEQLGALDPNGEPFGTKAKELAHEVRHHLKEEERGFFQVAGRILTETQKQRLARAYLKDYARMKKSLAQSWGWAGERATRTDTEAVRSVRRAPAPPPAATRVAKVVAATRRG